MYNFAYYVPLSCISGRFDSGAAGAPWSRPKRSERAYMDIVKNIQRTHEVLTPAGPVDPRPRLGRQAFLG